MSVKSILKKTREAIDTKDYAEALKLSKSVLKEDKNNYVALVYAGLASLEIGARDEAEHYYDKAITTMPANNLAWQGIVNLYDKCLESSDADSTLIVKKQLKAYTKLIELDSDDGKVSKILVKIERPELTNISSADVIDALNNFLSFESLSHEIKLKIQGIILKLLSSNNVEEKYHDLFESCYASAQKDLISENAHLTHLKLVFAKGNFKVLYDCMKTLNNDFLTILDWQCELFIKYYVLRNDNYKMLYDLLQCEPEKLSRVDSKYSWLTDIIMKVLNEPSGATFEIKDALIQVVTKNPTFLLAWIVLSECYMELQFDQEAINAISTVKKLLTLKTSNKYHERVDLLICYSFCKSNKDDELLKVIEIAEKKVSESEMDTKLLASLLEAHLKLNNIEAAEKVLEKIDKSSPCYHLMKALTLKYEGDNQSAIKELEQNVQDSSEYWLMLGDLYWSDEMSKSLVSYLKATKASPNYYICYERLGRYYLKVGDLDKSKRCYEKSFKIKSSKTVCIHLSKIYRKLQKWDENLSLLLTLTSGNITIDNAWSYFQLGIHYYERENFSQALSTLRLVIRVEPNNSFCWECLGDCYISEGAYTSALKCYQKVKSINAHSLYAMLQIANVKKLLGEFVDARNEFELILELDANYIPALKGVGGTCYLIAKQHFYRQLYGLTRDALQSSLNYVSRALHVKGSLSCCWKIAADCCYMASLLPFRNAFLSVSGVINDNDTSADDSCPISDELLKYAIQLYCKTLSLNEDNIYIYHDLACCYLQYAKLVRNEQEKEDFLKHALTMIQHCIANNATYAKHWNVLGNIFFQSASKKIELAQHAFIKGVTLDRNHVVSWTNLGALYLYLNELKLANQVFSQAQKCNPNYVNCWIGQALIAEASDMRVEAMDLFRHTMELAYHPEGTIGYAHWVCKTLMTKRRGEVIYEIDNMHAIPVACDGLRWYVENNPHDACGLNMFGMLCERLGLTKSAKDAYAKAGKYSEKREAFANLGRALYSFGEYGKAIEVYESIPEKNVNGAIGYALTLFKAERYEEAYQTYENVLNGDLDGKHIQADLLVALASMNYMFGGPDPTKDLLFQSINLESRSSWSLYAVLSLGLLHDDLNLATLALEEIKKQDINEENLSHYANLLVYTFLIQGKYQTAVSQLSNLIHKYPDSSALWLALSALLYRIRDAKPMNNVIVKCAQASLLLKGNNANLSMVLPMVAATSILSGDLRNALKTAQRQVHYYPNDDKAYQILRVGINAM